MKALVAGGAGFVGSHLCGALLADGAEVVCLDNFYIGTRENVRRLEGAPGFSLYERDICEMEPLKEIFARERFSYVFHLAANSDIRASAEDPAIEYRNTYTTTANLLECMRIYGVKRLFFASTSAVYGEKDGTGVAEDDSPLQPVSYYGAAKLGSEALISAYTHMNGLSSLVFRFPNVVGPRLTHGAVFDFINKLKADESRLVILGDGTQSKPYMHVSDLIRGIMRFKESGAGVTVYNIGVETQTTVKRIADIVCGEMGLTGVRYEYTGGRGGWPGDVPVFSYNLSKIHSEGWRAEYSSDEAVRRAAREAVSLCAL
jgi:UDP-glucose 4-epimerase